MSASDSLPGGASAAAGPTPIGEPVPIGSEMHKRLFCRMLLDTYDPYKPAVIDWPTLEPAALARLTSLPFWDMAVATEEIAGRRMEALANASEDALIREAVALNAFEERRHKDVLGHMILFYGIALAPEPPPPPAIDPLWGFLRTGYGECFDSFFAFGLFELAKRSSFFPTQLVEVFEPVIQEEARHNLFFVNWVAYMRARRGGLKTLGLAGLAFRSQCLAALAVQAWNRLKSARGIEEENFTAAGRDTVGIDLSPREFLQLCLTENDRRLAGYDPRLLRPRIMPAVARVALRFLREKKGKTLEPQRHRDTEKKI